MTVPGAGTEGTMAHEHDWGPEGFCRDVGCAASAAETVRDFRAKIARLVEFGGKLTRAKDAEIARLTHDNGVLRLSRDGEIGARKLAEGDADRLRGENTKERAARLAAEGALREYIGTLDIRASGLRAVAEQRQDSGDETAWQTWAKVETYEIVVKELSALLPPTPAAPQ